MERTNLFRKLNFLIALAAFFAAAIFCGCGNLLSSAEIGAEETAVFSQPREGYGTISGVLPSTQSPNARTAMPSSNQFSNVSYNVFAMNDSDKILADVEPDGTFFIELPFGTWSVTANAVDSSGKMIATWTEKVTISESEPNVSVDFTLKYSTNPDDGAGDVSLSISFPNTVKSAEWILEKGSTKFWKKVNDTDISNGSFKIEETLSDLGAYNLTINFYGDFSNLVYRIDQIVNIYANLTTDTFMGSAEYISPDGDVVLDEPMLKKFQNTTLYVGGTDINGKPASDTNTGTQFDPLATLNRALDLMNNSDFDPNTEFRVFLKGDVGDGAPLSLNETKTKTLTIASADSTAHTITGIGNKFTIPTNTKLITNNVTFTNIGFTVEDTFEMNASSVNGGDSAGGIYVEGNASLTMNGGEITDCHSSADGGGLNVQIGGTANLTGVKITACDAAKGGAVYTNGTLTMTNCDIGENTTNGSGGGVYVYRNGTFTMNGGEISGNTADGDGAGVYVADGGTFTMNGAAKITEDNDVYISSGVVKIGELSLSEDVFAKITIPQDLYKNGTKIIHKDDGTITDEIWGKICDKFKITPDSSGVKYKLIPEGEYGVLKRMSDLIYVRGIGAGWYEDNGKGDIIGNDDNSGSLDEPFKTIQKAISTVIDRNKENNDNDDYTIYVDGEVTPSDADLLDENVKDMASFAALDKTLNLTITALSDTKKATLNANNKKRVINAAHTSTNGILKLTLKKLVIKNGSHTAGYGGGIHFNSKNGSLTMSGCDITNNEAKQGGGISVLGGTLTATDCTISHNNNASDSGGGVYIGDTGKLELNNVEISGNTASGSGGGIYVNNGTLTLGGTVNIIGNTASGSGGGIYFQNNSNMLTIGGGVMVSGNTATNHGGGVYAYRPASTDTVLEMIGGEISGNTAQYGGGVYAYCGFEMSGGKISGNGEISGNNTKALQGGGVYVCSSGKFTMTDGIIGGSANGDGNKAEKGAGVYVDGCVFEMGKGTISGNNATRDGGGLYVKTRGTLTMTEGAVVEKNTADTNGGGIFIEYNGTVIMNGGTISENTAESGAGIHSVGGTIALNDKAKVINNHGSGICATGNADESAGTTLTMINGAEVSGNKSTAESGGVLVNNKSTFTMSGGTISGNTTTKRGGGVYVGKNGTFKMNGGTISSNTADTYGNGVYVTAVTDGKGTFMMSGNAKIEADNDVYLCVDTEIATIQITGTLNDTSDTSVATITPSSYKQDTQILSPGTGIPINQTICDKFAVTPQKPDGTKWKIMLNSANNTGVLKKGDLSGGIEIVIPGLETYTFKVVVNDSDEDIVEGMTLHSGSSVTLKEVKDSKERIPSGSLTVAIRDSSGTPFPGSPRTSVLPDLPASFNVPDVPPGVEIPAQVYLELTLDDGTVNGTVKNKIIDVTISSN